MIIRLSNGNSSEIDPEDYQNVNNHKWYENKGYAETKINGLTVGLHRFITGAKAGEIVDHINRNRLDNRRTNLRITSRQGNAFNTKVHRDSKTQVQGVVQTNNGKFVVYSTLDGKSYNLGTYSTLKEANKVYLLLTQMRNLFHRCAGSLHNLLANS